VYYREDGTFPFPLTFYKSGVIVSMFYRRQ